MGYFQKADLSRIEGAGFDPATDTLEKIRDEQTIFEGVGFNADYHSLKPIYSKVDAQKAYYQNLTFDGNNLQVRVNDKGVLNDVSTAQVNTEVDTALNTAIPGSPVAGSINDVLKDVDDGKIATTLNSSASEVLLNSNDTETTANEVVYTLVKQTICNVSGLLRVKFDLKGNFSDLEVNGRIYRSGIAHGTERFKDVNVYETFTEDLIFIKGDGIEIWCKSLTGANYYVQNFRLYGDVSDAFLNTVT